METAEATRERLVAGLRRLNDLGSLRGSDPRDALHSTLEAGLAQFGMACAFVGRVVDAGEVAVEAQASQGGARPDGAALALAHRYCRSMLAAGTGFAVADAAAPGPNSFVGSCGSYIGMPLRDGGTITGVLCFSSVEPKLGGFDEADHEFLRLLGRLVDGAREQQDAIRQLTESRAQFVGIIESAMDAIITHDKDQRVVIFNAAAEKIFGYSAAEVIGKPLDLLIPERFRAAHQVHVMDFAKSGRTHRVMGGAARIRALRRNGEEFPCEAAISRVFVEGRQLLTVIMRDVTERERTELARRVLEVRAQQNQKMDALGTLAGGIAHDFNNVLAVISMSADVALQEDLSDGARECVDAIVGAGDRARDLVKRILTFSRKQAVTRAPLSLQAAVEDALVFLRSTIPAGIELVARLDPDVPLVMADRTEIHQLLINLCTNAWHAIGDRTGRIQVELKERAVTQERADTLGPDLALGRYACLTITDTGEGMDEGTLRRVFEPFFTTKAAGKGTGLGLSVVHGVVAELHGDVSVVSEPGKGTTFTVMLPVVAAEAPARRASEAPETSAPAGRQVVLVLDDEELIVRAASLILRRAGYDVVPFTRPDAALTAVAATSDIAAMLVDLNMPQMNGIEFVRALASLGCKAPVVLMSGNLTREQYEAGERAGVRAFLAKPYSASQLRTTVAEVLEPAPASTKPA